MELSMRVRHCLEFRLNQSVREETGDKRGERPCLRIRTVFMVILSICFFLSVNFVILSLYTIEDKPQKIQLLAMATSFFVGGAVITILYIVAVVAMRVPS